MSNAPLVALPALRIWPVLLLVAFGADLAAGRPASAADPQRSDEELVADCAKEIGERFLGAAPDHLDIVRQELGRSQSQISAKLTVATGEGRTASATCIFTSGKLFDVVR